MFPRLLPRFLKRYPDVDVMLETPLNPPEQVTRLRAGQIDVGFPRLPVRDAALVVVPILTEALVAALPMRHPLARRRSVTLRELAASTFVMFRRRNSPGLYDVIMGTWRAAGLKPKVLEESMQMATILRLVAMGRGVSLVPHSAMGLGRQGVVFRPVRPALPRVGTAVAFRRATTSPIVSAFLDMVEAVFRTRLPRSLPRPAGADRKRVGKALRST